MTPVPDTSSTPVLDGYWDGRALKILGSSKVLDALAESAAQAELGHLPSNDGSLEQQPYLAVHADFAAVAVELLDYSLSSRLVELMRLIALGRRHSARAELLPSWDGFEPQWRWSPTEVQKSEAAGLIDDVHAKRGGSQRELEDLYRTVVQEGFELVDDHGLGTYADRIGGARARSVKLALNTWSLRVQARLRSGVRLALRLERAGQGWALVALAVSLTEETTQVPVHQALESPGLMGCDLAVLRRVLDLEWRAAQDASPGLRAASNGTVELEGDAVLDLLDEWMPSLWDSGIEVTVPESLLRLHRLSHTVRVKGLPSGLDDETLSLRVDVDLDGERLSAGELELLAASKEPLLVLGGRWVRVNRVERDRAAAMLRRAQRAITAAELIELEADGLDLTEVDGWVGQVLRDEWSPSSLTEVAVPPGLQATLRPYQRLGLNWLSWLESNGLGGVLADDMGLGKTLQVLSRITADHQGPTLVVCPTSVVTNWVREATRFSPELKVAVYHGPGRDREADFNEIDLVVTTYGLLRRDELIKATQWHRAILDEAQAIKNPLTATAKAAFDLQATHKLAVTGTPVENHLGDLWSLMRFAHPGLLGSQRSFKARWGLDGSGERVERLRKLVAPFMLRRAKTDEGVAPDLPPCVRVQEDCGLTREQMGMYEAVAKAMLEAAQEAEDDKTRRMHILAGITKLKQICVHPALPRGVGQELIGRSGKLERLEQLSSEITAAGDSVLVYSQFAKWLPALARHLAERTGAQADCITGKMSVSERDRVISDFTHSPGPQILCVSLRAGGVGLNLVRANHVIHMDQWWNPAVEDQASDRAHRIGQSRSVEVHKLVCPGTLEERISALLEEKRQLASSVVRSAEDLVSSLSDDALADFVGLVRSEVIR